MKFGVLLLSLLILFVPRLTWAYDWEEDEGAQGNREIQANQTRTYPGGADEQDLKVQKFIAVSPRSPDAPELVKRADAEPDDHSPTE